MNVSFKFLFCNLLIHYWLLLFTKVGDRRRRSRQLGLEDFLPGEEILEAVVKDYVDDEAGEDGSGLKQLLAAFKSWKKNTLV